MKKFFILFVLGLARPGAASTLPLQGGDTAPLLGHNLTPTSYNLTRGQLTVGSYALGYGITDHWSVATSPWFILGYNMPLLGTKVAFAGNEIVQQFSLEAMYFKTFHYGLDRYTQESFFGRFTGSHRFNSVYALHASLGYQYFLNDDRPYSFRLSSGNGDRYNVSLGFLNELRVFDHAGALFELGALGLNYAVPYLHLGASIYYAWKWGYAQVGLSKSTSFTDDTDWIIHPEVQLQAFFF